jgi:hypothetical protein
MPWIENVIITLVLPEMLYTLKDFLKGRSQ